MTAAQAETALVSAALPIGAGSRSVVNPNGGAPLTISWGTDAPGAGLITADAAISAIP